MFRDYPTLPADPCEPSNPLPGARSNDQALLLPKKHCAFNGCAWCGKDSMSLVMHILENHEDDLKPAMQCFEALRPCVYEDENMLALSVYNEGIAIPVRRGAPLASYSIDRKCLNQYTYHLTNADTNASVCFVCARRVPM